jgi:hypothetical protein
MSQLQKIFKPTVARLHNDVPRVLHSSDAHDTTGQTASGIYAGGDPARAIESWPGCSLGVRAPGVGETALSVSEVEHLIKVMYAK